MQRARIMLDWGGVVCRSCLASLVARCARCPDTASLRAIPLDASSWDQAAVYGNGRVFAPGATLARLHPPLMHVKIWQHPHVSPESGD